MLRLIKYLLVLALLAAVSLPVVLVVAGLQPEPLVPLRGTQTPGDVARAKALIEKYDPRDSVPVSCTRSRCRSATSPSSSTTSSADSCRQRRRRSASRRRERRADRPGS